MTADDTGYQVCEIADMSGDDPEPLLYRQLMAVKPAAMTKNQWMVEAGVNRTFFNNLRKRGRARSDTIERLLDAIGVSPAQFYAMDGPSPTPAARESEVRSQQLPFRSETEKRDIPLIGTGMGADYEINVDGEMIFSEVTDLFLGEEPDHVRRPRALEGRSEVYALTVVGESMHPRYDPGDPVYVDPKATARIGDDVVVYLRRGEDDGERIYSVLIKRLDRSTSGFVELHQFKPAVTFTVSRSDIAKIHRIIPWREMTMF